MSDNFDEIKFDFGDNSDNAGSASGHPPIFEDFDPLDIADLDLDNIPPRRWVYGKLLVRGYISCWCGSGGVGKTSLALAVMMSIATGKPLLGLEDGDEAHKVHKQGAVLYYNLEDQLDEMKLRLAAEVRHRNIKKETLAGRMFLASGRDNPFCVASLDGGTVIRHDIQPAIDMLKRNGIIAMVVDPLVNAHALDGNRNEYIAVVVDQFRQIADQADCAILLVHHFRKGGEAGNVESSLGAVSLTNGCRVVETVSAMSTDDAAAMGVEVAKRRAYVRIDNAKMNLAATGSGNIWFQFHSVHLGNGTEEYPEGDDVGVLMRWKALPPLTGHSWDQIATLFDKIDLGPSEGEYYSNHSNSSRWVVPFIADELRISTEMAKLYFTDWWKEGVFKMEDYKSKERANQTAKRLKTTPSGREKQKIRMAGRT